MCCYHHKQTSLRSLRLHNEWTISIIHLSYNHLTMSGMNRNGARLYSVKHVSNKFGENIKHRHHHSANLSRHLLTLAVQQWCAVDFISLIFINTQQTLWVVMVNLRHFETPRLANFLWAGNFLALEKKIETLRTPKGH